MNTIELIHIFEKEWLPKYPDIRQFSTDSIIRDIEHWRNALVTDDHRDSLVKFLMQYLKEHPDRFQYAGMNHFRLIKNMPPRERPNNTPQN